LKIKKMYARMKVCFASTNASYRKWADAEFAKQQQKRSERPTTPPRSGKRAAPAAIEAPPARRHVRLGALQPQPPSHPPPGADLPIRVFNAQIVASNTRAATRLAQRNPDCITMTWRQAELLRDSLRRARDGAQHSQNLAQQLAEQFAREARVVSVAYDTVDQIMQECEQGEA